MNEHHNKRSTCNQKRQNVEAAPEAAAILQWAYSQWRCISPKGARGLLQLNGARVLVPLVAWCRHCWTRVGFIFGRFAAVAVTSESGRAAKWLPPRKVGCPSALVVAGYSFVRMRTQRLYKYGWQIVAVARVAKKTFFKGDFILQPPWCGVGRHAVSEPRVYIKTKQLIELFFTYTQN